MMDTCSTGNSCGIGWTLPDAIPTRELSLTDLARVPVAGCAVRRGERTGGAAEAVGTYCEQPITFYGADGNGRKSSGQDDMFGNSYTFSNDGISTGIDYGTTYYYSDFSPTADFITVAESYRWFKRDNWTWRGPMIVNVSPNDVSGFLNEIQVFLTLVYYSQ